MLKKIKVNYQLFAMLLVFMVLFRTLMCFLRLRAGAPAEYLLNLYMADNCMLVVTAFALSVLHGTLKNNTKG